MLSLHWWQSRIFTVRLPNRESLDTIIPVSFEVTRLPSQHHFNEGNQQSNMRFVVWMSSRPSRMRSKCSEKPQHFQRSLTTITSQSAAFSPGTPATIKCLPVKRSSRHPSGVYATGDRFNGFDLALLPIGDIVNVPPSLTLFFAELSTSYSLCS